MTDAIRQAIATELLQMSPEDAYHEDAKLDADTYYAAMDRAVQLVLGKIKYHTDLKPEGDST